MHAAFAAPYEFNSDTTITNSPVYADGFHVGPNGTVVVQVTGSGEVTSDGRVSLGTTTNGHGTLILTGPNARLNVNNFSPMVVGDAGTGALILQGGSQAALSNLLAIGNASGSTGSTLVTGDGSLLTAREIQVGRGGNGTLDVTDGGAIVTNRPYAPADYYGLSIGAQAGSTGIVNVADRGSITVTDNFLLIGEGGTGALNIGDAGKVVADRGVLLGSAGGTGVLNIGAGAELTTGQLTIGQSVGGTGAVNLTGTGKVNVDSIWVGSNGDGVLTVDGGAVLAATIEVHAERATGVSGDHGQAGRIVVSGAGSAIRAPRVYATNELLVERGAAIRSDTARIKDSYADGPAVATLTGAGSNWTNSGVMEVFGNLDVLDGAAISTDTLSISGGLNSATLGLALKHEQVRVSGAGSSITAANGITVGKTTFEPFGVLGAANGGRIDGGSGITLGQSGYLVLGGGMQQWSVPEGPVWRAAEAAGELSAAPILMEINSGGLVLNHTGNLVLSNTVHSVENGNTFTGGALNQLAGTTTFSGDLSGFGGAIRVSAGTLRIDSDLYAGQGYMGSSQAAKQQIEVTGGTLVLNGSAGFQQEINYGTGTGTVRSSLVAVRDQGVLAGNATVGETHVFNGGTLSPGQSGVGTITVDGDLYLSANGNPGGELIGPSYFDVDVLGNGQSDRLAVAGTAYLGRGSNLLNTADANVRITGLDPSVSYQDGQAYTILEAAGGVQGQFDAVVSQSAFLAPTLAYAGNGVQLIIAVKDGGAPVDPGKPVDPGNGGHPVVFGAVAATGNQRATAAALDSLRQSGDALALYNSLLMLDAAAARNAFDDLSGEIHASNRALLLDDRFLRDGISQRLRPDPTRAASGPSAWLSGAGTAARRAGNYSEAATGEQRQGLMAGADWTVAGAWMVGLAAGTESLRQQVDDRHSRAEVDALHAGLYAGYRGEQLWVNGGASYADYDVDTTRSVGAGTDWAQTLNSSYNAHAVSVFAEGGWDLELGALTLSPYLALAYTRLSTAAGLERGGNAALAVESGKDAVWTTTAGMRAAWDISGGQRDLARLEAGLAWQNAGGDLRTGARQRFIAGSDSFTVGGAPLARNVGIAELGVAVHPTDNSRLSLFAQGRAGDGLRELGAQLNWSVAF